MRSALTILLILIVGPAWGQPQRDRFAAEVASAVFSSALDFIAPRALEAVSIQQLAIWGLRGITTLDATLTPNLTDGVVTLRRGAATLFQRAAPRRQQRRSLGRPGERSDGHRLDQLAAAPGGR